jgi:hypothetical protein
MAGRVRSPRFSVVPGGRIEKKGRKSDEKHRK